MHRTDLAPTSSSWPGLPRAVLAAGLLLALALLAAIAGLSHSQYQQMQAADLRQAQAQAQLLQEQAQRAVRASAGVLDGLADRLSALPYGRLPLLAAAELVRQRAALPVARELSLLDASGQVLASSAKDDVGRTQALRAWGALPLPGASLLGGYVRGRGLDTVAPEVPAATGFVPLIRALRSADGIPVYLLAQLDLQTLSGLQPAGQSAGSTYLLSPRGEVLASGGRHALAGGANLAGQALPGATALMPAEGTRVGPGLLAPQQLQAFSAAPGLPLLALVEQPQAQTLDRWFGAMRGTFVAGTMAALFLAAVAVLASRALRRRDALVAELQAAQALAARQRDELAGVLHNTQALIVQTDAQGRLRQVGARWLAAMGQTPEQALGRPLADWALPDEREQLQALFSTAQPGEAPSATLTLCAQDGTPRRFELTAWPSRSTPDGSGYMVSALDLSPGEAGEQALRRQLDFVALLLEVSPQPLALYDKLGCLVMVNQAWEDLTGFAREQVLGRTDAGFQPAELARQHALHDADLWQAGGQSRYAAQLQRRDGSQRELQVVKQLVSGNAQHQSSLLCSLTDVSEFRRSERLQASAQRVMEESARALAEMVARVGQDLCEPLQAVLGYSELGLLRGRNQPVLASMFEDIHAAGRRMAGSLDNLLEAARAGDAARPPSGLQRMDLRSVVSGALIALGPQADALQLRVKVNLGTDALPARVDARRLTGAVRRLLQQAMQCAAFGAQLEIGARLLPEQGQACISLCGLDSELDPAGQAWSMCQQVVAAHGGRLQAGTPGADDARLAIFLPVCGPAELPSMASAWIMPPVHQHLVPDELVLH